VPRDPWRSHRSRERAANRRAGNQLAGNTLAGNQVAGNQIGRARVGQLFALVLFSTAATCGWWAAAHAAQPAGGDVDVIDFAFAPPNVTIGAGGTVVFRNDGRATHRIVADDGGFDSHGLQPGHAWSVMLGAPGVVPFHDAIYPQMKGTIVVTAAKVVSTASEGTSAPATSASTTTVAITHLASTGAASGNLAFVAVVLLVLGAMALVVARPLPPNFGAGGGSLRDDLLPDRERLSR